MDLTAQREKDKKARDAIVAALKEYSGIEPRVPAFTKLRIPHQQYNEKLTREGINEGLIVLGLLNNMSGISAGDFNLFKLLHEYILNLPKRDKINATLREK